MRVVVTGGAGYIGSNTTLQLLDAGYDVVVADNLSRGHRKAVEPHRLREVDLLDTEGLIRVLGEQPCQAVIHFARRAQNFERHSVALSQVGQRIHVGLGEQTAHAGSGL